MMGGSGTKAPNCGCTSQVSRALGNDLRNTATDGSVCIISPSELILMMSIFLYSIQVPKNVIIENSIAVILHKPRQAPFFQSSASFRFHTIFCIKANKLPPVYRKNALQGFTSKSFSACSIMPGFGLRQSQSTSYCLTAAPGR